MRLEDVDFIFETGGITGGVLSKGGRVADRRGDIEHIHHRRADLGAENEKSSDSGSYSPTEPIEIYEHREKR